MLQTIGKIIFFIVSMIFTVYFVINLLTTLKIILTNRVKKHHKLKIKFKHKLYHIKWHKYPLLIEFLKWVTIDIIRGKTRFKLFGIWCFTGYYGQGKSLGAVTFAKDLQQRRKLKGDIWHIVTNFNCKGQLKKITCWQDMLNLPPQTIVIFDEIQSTFESTKYNAFPLELLWKITQCRKHKLVIFASSPVYTRMSIQLRQSTDFVIECANMLNADRWFRYVFYRGAGYEKTLEGAKKSKFKLFTRNIVATDRDYNQYNTEEQIDRFDIEEDTKKVSKLTYRKVKEEILKEVSQMIKKVS